MKKIIYLLLLCFIVPLFSFIGTGCGPIENLDQYVVKNWGEYKAIGAGYIENVPSSSSARTMSRQQNAEGKKPKLIGIKQDGSYEPIVFQDKNDKEVTPQLFLYSFAAFENFTFINYSSRQETSIIDYFYTSPELQSYVIDNKTGKIYNFSNIYSFDVMGRDYWDGQGESKDAIFTVGAVTRHNVVNGGEHLCKMSVENGQLKVEEIVDVQHLTQFRRFIVDRNNNVFSHDYEYVITADKQIHKLNYDHLTKQQQQQEQKFYKGLDGLIYSGNYVFVDGSWKEADRLSVDCLECYGDGDVTDDYLLTSVGDTSYYYKKDGVVVKTIQTSPDWVDVEYITLEDFEKREWWDEFIFANDRLYFMDSSEVYYVSIFDGKKTVVENQYVFYEIWQDHERVCFKGYDVDLNQVSGVINSDNSVTIGIEEIPYNIIYIKAIN